MWSSLLNVLIALAAVLAALPIAGLIAVTLWGRRNGRMRRGPFDLGRWNMPAMIVSVVWTVGLCGVLVYQDPRHVGLGLVVCITISLALYPLVRRPKTAMTTGSPGSVDDALASERSADSAGPSTSGELRSPPRGSDGEHR